MKKVTKPVAIVLTLLILIFALLSFFGISKKWGDSRIYSLKGIDTVHLGRELGDETAVVLQARSDEFRAEEQMGDAMKSMGKRLNDLGVFDNEPGADLEKNKAIFSFSEPTNADSYNSDLACNYLGKKSVIKIKKSVRQNFMQNNINATEGETVVDNEDILSAELIAEKQNRLVALRYGIKLNLSKEGQNKLSEYVKSISTDNDEQKSENEQQKNEDLEVFLDDEPIALLSASSLRTNKKVSLFGDNYNLQTVREIVSLINGGSLTTDFSCETKRVLSPSLGFKIKKSVFATLSVLFVLLLILLILKYRAVGIVSGVVLIGHSCGVITTLTGFFPFLKGTELTLPTLGGILVGLILGVCSVILVANRISRKLKDGRGLDSAIIEGYKEAFRLTLNWIVKILIVAIVSIAIFLVPNNTIDYIFPGVSKLSLCSNAAISSFGINAVIGLILVMLFEFLLSKLILRSLSKFGYFRNVKLYGGVK